MAAAMSKMSKYTDLLGAGAIVLVVVMMIVPLPPQLLDLFISLNISAALAILVATMYMPRALDFAAFPSLLLITTLFRLAINVSVTRLVLLHGDAGDVVSAFGNFVVGGNVVVGLVVFLILVVIQFVVVTNGSGRVAEVAARFTLDAMPGKQMAIDADLNSGLITDEQARKRRSDISREADFYGAMDGASKFVKGDAIAAVVIVVINLLGGFAVGVIQHHLSVGEAIQRYALLSVGDGLVSQIPALLISIASGIVVTRGASEGDGGLGADVAGQLLRNRRVLGIAATAIGFLAILPGLPKLPFIVICAALAITATRQPKPEALAIAAAEQQATAELSAAPADSPEALLAELSVEPLELELAPDLFDLVDVARGGNLLDRVRALRRQIATDLGLVVPLVRTRDNLMLPPATYVIRVHGVEVARGDAPPGCVLVLA